MTITKEAKIGSLILLAVLITAFLWVFFHEKEEKYYPPYKYYSGDKPDYSSQKSSRNKFFPAEQKD
ncbi:MAG: hypothetical protein JXR59_05460 [Desulfuromonadaceae bacterium]|nr:hypothetical protein [Desulfuromonadaceae bacterium]